MMIPSVTVRVPATTANLGPGFDCLGLALNLWNETTFSLQGTTICVKVEGEGEGCLPEDENNLLVEVFLSFCKKMNLPVPAGLHITCRNHVPTSSGLGSSATALLAGLLAANALHHSPASPEEILTLAADMEGHADNAAAALYGGLTAAAQRSNAPGWLVRRYNLPQLSTVVILPNVDLPTHTARQALPEQVSLRDAVFNLGCTALVIDALRTGDLDLLGEVMQDRLHQPYRLPLIPGSANALAAARQAGAAAAGISGAGPSLIAFVKDDGNHVADAMTQAFNAAGVASRSFHLSVTNQGASVHTSPPPLH